MPGKLEYWSREEIGTVIVFLDAVNFPHEEICRRISEVCGMDAVSRKEVDHILAAGKKAEVPTAAGIAPLDENLFSVLPTEEDIEISDLPELFSESILNYPVQSSKYQWNSVSQFHPLHFGKTTDVQNCDGVRDQMLHDKLHNILESFSPQNFSVSVSEVKQLGITTEGNLNEVIDVVFEKAIDKPAFSIPYANMCKLLTLLKVPCSGQQTHFVDIRELLLTKCQKEFERNEVNQLCREEISMPVQMCEAVDQEQLQTIIEEELNSRRQRQLGTARFVAWLFKLDIFTESMMHQCIKNLLLQDGEVAVECVCILIIAVGNELCSDKIESHISDLKRKIDKQYASAKLGTILQHIDDLKVNNWMSYSEENSTKIIDEILLEGCREMPMHKKMSLPIDFDNSLSDDHEQQENQWSPLNPERKKQYDREFLLNLQSQPMSMKKPSNLPNLDVIKDKATLHKLNELNNRMAFAAQYRTRGGRYTDPFEPAFARTNAPGRGPNNWMSYSEENSTKIIDEILLEGCREMPTHKKMSLPIDFDNSLSDDHEQQENQWSPLNPERKKQYDREFLLNLQSQPMCMKKPSNLPNLDVIKDKATLHKLNELNNRMAFAAQYRTRGGRYTDPFEPAFARTNAPGRGPNNWMSYSEENSTKIIDEILLEGCREMPTHKKMSLPIDFDNSLSDDHEQQENQWSPLNPERKKQYDREFLLNLQSQPMCMKKPSNLPNLDVIKDKATLHKLNELNNRMAFAAQYRTRGGRYTDPFESAFARTNAPGRGPNNWMSYSEENSTKIIDEILLEGCREMPTHKKMSLPIDFDNSLSDDHEQQENQWSPLNPERKKQYDREFLLNLQSQPMCMKKPSNLPNLDVIKDKATLHKLNELNNRMAFAAQYRTRGGRYTDPFEPAFARTNAPGRGPMHSGGVKGRGSIGHENKPPRNIINRNTPANRQIKLHTAENAWAPSRKNETEVEDARTQIKVPSGVEGTFVNFRKLLLTKCQREFEKDRTDEQNREERIRLIQESETKLEFTTKQTAEPKLRKQITPEDVKQNLQRLLHDHESNEEIFNWLERHIEGEMSPPTYRALVTVIYESVITGSGTNCELNSSKLKERMCILARYMDVNRNLGLHAIFALQYLMNKLDHPEGILLQIFELAYNEDFLSDDAFKQWEHCDDPAEQEGKGVAIHSVSSFFTWLKKGEDDESAEGD